MYNASNLNSMKRIVYMLAVLFYGTSLFAQDKPFDIEHAPAPLFRCPIYDGPTDPTLEWNTEAAGMVDVLHATPCQCP